MVSRKPQRGRSRVLARRALIAVTATRTKQTPAAEPPPDRADAHTLAHPLAEVHQRNAAMLQMNEGEQRLRMYDADEDDFDENEHVFEANETLTAANEELREHNAALLRMNDDVENVIEAMEMPILFVSLNLNVRRFNRTAATLFGLGTQAEGTRLPDLESTTLDIPQLTILAGGVIETGQGVDEQILDLAGDWKMVRIRAYRTCEGGVDGAIISILDINALKGSVAVAEAAALREQMLSQASTLLAASLDYETTLDAVARLSTADFADWCAVDLVNEEGEVRHLTVSHADPGKRDLARQFQETAFREPEHAPGAPQALRLRKSVLLHDLAEAALTGSHPEARIMELITALGVRSLISVPLVVRGKVLGIITFSSSGRRYELTDLHVAEALSERAAVAIDTAMLFREAESANRYKDSFLGTVAHELRTPLTSIIGWVDLAKQDRSMLPQALVSINESASLMRVFVDDLLDLTRIREQKLSMASDEIDLIAVLQSALTITQPNADANGIRITLDLRTDRAPVRGDRVRLLQVVWNLLGNAVKFTPRGGQISVRLEREAHELRLWVTDTGVGISAEFAPHAFDLFRQAEPDTHRYPGLGIGLSIVSQIIGLHGGTVRIDRSEPGHGSTFVVTLPIAEAAETVPARRRAGKPRRAEARLLPAGHTEEIA